MGTNSHSIPTISHRFGFLQHGNITDEIRAIDADKRYAVTDIPPNGPEKTTHYVGSDIRKRYLQIFGTYTHAFIVTPEGSTVPVFIYEGPLSAKVDSILSSLH
ncbi:hypothetical protein H7169_00050 [Candidatus Gracilibacteria bacterium]|nr:hypothetical protein [Candidatus Gracilibacteria bacterium]